MKENKLPIDTLKALIIRRINAYRDKKLTGGFYFNDVKFDSDSESLRRVAMFFSVAVYELANDLSHTEKILNSAGNVVNLTTPQVIQFGLAAIEHEKTTITVAYVHTRNISQMTNRNDIVNYDYKIGW